MPQISPLLWLWLFVYFWLGYLVLLMKIYYFK